MRYSFSGLLALVLGTSCSDGDARKSASEPDYREVPEAAAACGLARHAVINRPIEGRQNNLMVLPTYDNTTAEMRDAKACLRRWAEAHGYIFMENESRDEE